MRNRFFFHLRDVLQIRDGSKIDNTSWLRDSFFKFGLFMASVSCTGTVAVSIDMLIILVKTGNKTSMLSSIIDAGRGSKLQVLRREELTSLQFGAIVFTY